MQRALRYRGGTGLCFLRIKSKTIKLATLIDFSRGFRAKADRCTESLSLSLSVSKRGLNQTHFHMRGLLTKRGLETEANVDSEMTFVLA